jgi:hypothetical protein
MVVSHSHAFLFIHVDKAAGTSIENALRPYASRGDRNRLRRRLVWLGRLNRIGGLHRSLQFPIHSRALQVQRCLPPQEYSRLFKFAFVRNPWDRLVSRYSFLLKKEDHHRHGMVQQMTSFEEYVQWELRRGKLPQYKYVTGKRGELIVDFIGYYERLHKDFAQVCQRLNITAELPHSNASSHRDYRTYYTPAVRDLVAREFERDIELFGYDFEGMRR